MSINIENLKIKIENICEEETNAFGSEIRIQKNATISEQTFSSQYFKEAADNKLSAFHYPIKEEPEELESIFCVDSICQYEVSWKQYIN